MHRIGVNVSSQPGAAPAAASVVDDSGQPAGYGNSCLVCHGNDVVTQQRLTRGQWEREVDKMVRWGARVKPEDRDAFLDYLMRVSRGSR